MNGFSTDTTLLSLGTIRLYFVLGRVGLPFINSCTALAYELELRPVTEYCCEACDVNAFAKANCGQSTGSPNVVMLLTSGAAGDVRDPASLAYWAVQACGSSMPHTTMSEVLPLANAAGARGT